MADLIPIIDQTARGPASAQNDGQQATAQPLPDLIKADQYMKGITATTAPLGPKSAWGLVRIARSIPGGPTD